MIGTIHMTMIGVTVLIVGMLVIVEMGRIIVAVMVGLQLDLRLVVVVEVDLQVDQRLVAPEVGMTLKAIGLRSIVMSMRSTALNLAMGGI